jgi:hypothetical protein
LRTCMFCHELADTREDAWPQWLIKRFPSSDIARTYLERGEHDVNSWHTRKPKLVVKRVCSGCNNGWMSRLESEAKPVLESILDGHLKSLDPSAQLTLAKWAVKTAMVLEAIDSSRPWFYSENERWLMREAQNIPVRTSVWIAKCIHHPHIYSVKKDLSTARGDDGLRAIATTMAFGFLAFQVVSIGTPPEIPTHVPVSYEVSNGPWEQTLVQIWPISDRLLTWPPYYGLDGDLGLDTLTERLSAAKWQSTDVASAE